MRFILILFLSASPLFARIDFMYTQRDLKQYKNRTDVIMVCSPGRSGSTMVAYTLLNCVKEKTVIKSHLLPPKIGWKGKILFIFSNPDLAAESAFHLSLTDPNCIHTHFNNVETADIKWLKRAEAEEEIVSLNNNLLTYDALGVKVQLNRWLITSVEKAPLGESNLLAVKYENLWDDEVIEAIKEFCQLNTFPLPRKKTRGYKDHLTQKEELIRATYNFGTENDPHYAAYVGARAIWEKAPKFQSYKIKNNPAVI